MVVNFKERVKKGKVLEKVVIPFDAHCCHMDRAIKHSLSVLVKPPFVIFDIQTL